MEIVKRHKDFNGKTIGYTLRNGKSEVYLNRDIVVSLFNQIDNATLLSNGEFRAKKGYAIETVESTKNLLVKSKRTNVKTESSCNVNFEYYGKDFINVCRKIRRHAIENKLEVSLSKHISNRGKNTHLFKLIEACGISVKMFIRGYLSVLQPYSLSKFQGSKDKCKSDIWLCDLGYNIALIIKITESGDDESVVVSFHESNNYRDNFSKGRKDFSDKLCAVFVDTVDKLSNCYSISYTIQRGFLRETLNSRTQYYNKGVALVKYEEIKNKTDHVMNTIFENLRETYLEESKGADNGVVWDDIECDKLSFMSLGNKIVNNICMLIDLYAFYRDVNTRLKIVEITNNLIEEIPSIRMEEIKLALKERFEGSPNKLYKLIADEGDEDK